MWRYFRYYLLPVFCSFFLTAINDYGQSVITTFAGNGTAGYSGDNGLATSAELNGCDKAISDYRGNWFLSDRFNRRIRKIDTNGIITTIVGTGNPGSSGDNGPALLAEVVGPCDLLFDHFRNLYFSDYDNCKIRRVDTVGIITTIAGTGACGYAGDNGLATSAQLCGPVGIAFDENGNLYIADEINCVIRKVDRSGIITTFAGTGVCGFTGDYIPATTAQLNVPGGIIFDKWGNLLFSDRLNYRIRKIDGSGLISTVAGSGVAGYSGDGGNANFARLNIPSGLLLDSVDNLFFADCFNNVIRKVSQNGIITTIAGNGFGSGSDCNGRYWGDGGSPLSASLNGPLFLSFDKYGNIFIGDECNNRIRKITGVGVMVSGVKSEKQKKVQGQVFPNPSNGNFTVKYDCSGKAGIKFMLFNLMGEVRMESYLESGEGAINVDASQLASGSYFYKLSDNGYTYIEGKLIIMKIE